VVRLPQVEAEKAVNPTLTSNASETSDRVVRVRGTVQGVGFRPFAQRSASLLGLRGWVLNDAEGVLVRVAGPVGTVERFIRGLEHDAPHAARVESVEECSPDGQPEAGDSFRIAESERAEGLVSAAVPPDLSLCADCRRELLDPAERRHGYPFINCTQCGPRYSILCGLPYDRPLTTMRSFRMCPACEAEYRDPSNRRFHAEPNACPECGPSLELRDAGGRPLAARADALRRSAEEIRRGAILAVKGVGGFHLVCDATNAASVAELRRRKHREEKPFAVMFPSVVSLRIHATVTEDQEAMLRSASAPIVLVRRIGATGLAAGVSPGNPWVGALLPYSPVHVLLIQACGRPLVATSANLSEEPLCTEDEEARERLAGMADYFLGHDREIARPVDDSVVRHTPSGSPIVLRRARGLAPSPLRLPAALPKPVLCVGAQMKSTVAVAAGSSVVLSPHIGDLGNPATEKAFFRTVAMLGQLSGVSFSAVAHDKHPGYSSTRHARSGGLRCVAVQHHLAHLLSCLLENGRHADGVLGVTWDGTGYGEDGTVWGGEFILLERGTASRFARMRTFPLIGGEAAVRDARRVVVGLSDPVRNPGRSAELAERLGYRPADAQNLVAMAGAGVNTPVCSSAGRLFDAWAALLGLGLRNSFEGQLPLSLEAAAMAGRGSGGATPFPLRPAQGGGAVLEVDWGPAFEAELSATGDSSARAAALHLGLARSIVEVAVRAGVGTVALTGGCFQNALLHDLAKDALEGAGFEVLVHRLLPPNDGGIAAGQALAALWGLADVQLPQP
jgi:hydrogenase maturation protein HypF